MLAYAAIRACAAAVVAVAAAIISSGACAARATVATMRAINTSKAAIHGHVWNARPRNRRNATIAAIRRAAGANRNDIAAAGEQHITAPSSCVTTATTGTTALICYAVSTTATTTYQENIHTDCSLGDEGTTGCKPCSSTGSAIDCTFIDVVRCT